EYFCETWDNSLNGYIF
nr:immunoglobulin light chain junction region [Macaca mulatta]MOW66825.1 immunoglobulin light chain junction region [Macaca mulatta]MOW66951.1 immunoglobulin light chain junction region [Macaca mulatta]MOW67273.1 immunoglobulin light chain junction region [Macaca mulatta]MOW68238.1 immunoglobulin light chain junction region [Macaca mulatta]